MVKEKTVFSTVEQNNQSVADQHMACDSAASSTEVATEQADFQTSDDTALVTKQADAVTEAKPTTEAKPETPPEQAETEDEFEIPPGPMSSSHPLWLDFVDDLMEALDMRFEGGTLVSDCTCSPDYPAARLVLYNMSFTAEEIEQSVEYFKTRRRYCDCEVAANWRAELRQTEETKADEVKVDDIVRVPLVVNMPEKFVKKMDELGSPIQGREGFIISAVASFIRIFEDAKELPPVAPPVTPVTNNLPN